MPAISSNKFVSFFSCLSVTEIQLYKQTWLLIYGQDSLSYKKLCYMYLLSICSAEYEKLASVVGMFYLYTYLPLRCSLYPESNIALCRRDFLV